MLREWQTCVHKALRRGDSPVGLFREGGKFSVLAAFRAYAEGHRLRVYDSLGDDFPLTARLLGRAGFARAIDEFLALPEREYELELGAVSDNFARFLRARPSAPLGRAASLDMLALSARSAPEPASPDGVVRFGLHPSARLLRERHHAYVVWRVDGSVLRERIDERTGSLLHALREPKRPEELGERLAELGEEPAFVQASVAEWSEAGVISKYQ